MRTQSPLLPSTHPYTPEQVDAWTVALIALDLFEAAMVRFRHKYNVDSPYRSTPKWVRPVIEKMREQAADLLYAKLALIPQLHIPAHAEVKQSDPRVILDMATWANMYHGYSGVGTAEDDLKVDVARWMAGRESYVVSQLRMIV